jgi:hypothetical protein
MQDARYITNGCYLNGYKIEILPPWSEFLLCENLDIAGCMMLRLSGSS